jgi:hypothetical protein
VDNIAYEQYTRNPHIMALLEDFGYVERRGLGVDQMIRAMRDAGLEPPVFENRGSSFWVTLKGRPPEKPLPNLEGLGLNERQVRAVADLRRPGPGDQPRLPGDVWRLGAHGAVRPAGARRGRAGTAGAAAAGAATIFSATDGEQPGTNPSSSCGSGGVPAKRSRTNVLAFLAFAGSCCGFLRVFAG